MSTATPSTTGTNTDDTRSTRRCTVDFSVCARSTAASIRPSRVCAPTVSARTTRRPPVAIVPAVTRSPPATSAGTGSPVIALVSTAALPSTTAPSAAIRSPGRTTNRSPTRSAPTGTRVSAPAASSTATSSVRSAASDRMTAPAVRRARASKYRPASTNVVTPAATSRYSGPDGCSTACQPPTAGAPSVNTSAPSDQPDAAITPRDTSVSIDVVPCRRFRAAAAWNGQAAHTTTGSASTATTTCQYGKRNDGTSDIASDRSASGMNSRSATAIRRRSDRSAASSRAAAPAVSSSAGSATTSDAP